MTETPSSGPAVPPDASPARPHRSWRNRADGVRDRVTRTRASTAIAAAALLLVGGLAGFGIAMAATDSGHQGHGRFSESESGHHGDRPGFGPRRDDGPGRMDGPRQRNG